MQLTLPFESLSLCSSNTLLEERLGAAIPPADEHPQSLHRAMRYAVFTGGKRLRPRLLLQVARACAPDRADSELALRAACAVELVHSASLVHDDLPCFDNAAQRRGHPTVHMLYGEAMAVLVGDALLSRAFEVLAQTSTQWAPQALRLLSHLGRATGSSSGIIGGQSLEGRPGKGPGYVASELCARYHAMKTGELFRWAAEAGALAAGDVHTAAWADVGQLIGMWYQLADDLVDVRGLSELMGKPVAQDAALARPNAVLVRGAPAVQSEMRGLLDQIRARVVKLAVAPEPLLTFVGSLHDHLLNVIGETKAA